MTSSATHFWGTLQPPADPLLTADDLLRMGDQARGYELIDGRLLQMAATGGEHGLIASEIDMALRAYVKPRRLGLVTAAETGFLISQPGAPDTVLAPDVAFVQMARAPQRGSPDRAGFWRLAPDLIVEVASPSQSRLELRTKAKEWRSAGVRLVWLVWPTTQQVEIWRLSGQPTETRNVTDMLDGEDVIPGFSHPIAALFSD